VSAVTKVILVTVLTSVLAVIAYAYINHIRDQIWPPKPPLPVEIADLKINGKKKNAKAGDDSSAVITFDLKHNDGVGHNVTVLFDLGNEGIRHASIATSPKYPLPLNGTMFYYTRPIYAADSVLSQRVLALTHIKDLASVTVVIRISLSLDGKQNRGEQSIKLQISK
jgi:hypothetical protein